MKSCFLLVAKRVQFVHRLKAKKIPIVLCSRRVFDYKQATEWRESFSPSFPPHSPSLLSGGRSQARKPGGQRRQQRPLGSWQHDWGRGQSGSRSGRASTCELTYFWPAQAGDGRTRTGGEPRSRRERGGEGGEAASQLNFPCCLAWATCDSLCMILP